MRTTRIAVVGGLVLTLAGMAFGQMSSNPNPGVSSTGNQMSMQNARATVQPGPYVGYSRYPSADVLVNGRFALRVPSFAGGLTPMQRARVAADRMNSAFAAGYTWNDTKVQQSNGLWTVVIGDRPIITADRNSARAMGISTGLLASRWARQSVVAMNGQPAMVAQAITPFPQQRVAGSRQELGGPAWAVSPTKNVPLIDASTGAQSGSIAVAGPQNLLNNVNAVALFTSTMNDVTAYTFVPITGTTVGAAMTRVNGVGVVGVPTDFMPVSNLSSAADFAPRLSPMSTRWNAAINSNLIQQRLQQLGNTKLVPLYSPDAGKVIGAVQVVGRASAVSLARSVTLSPGTGMYGFSVLSARPGTAMTADNTLNNVVVSAILVPAGIVTGTAPTTGTAPSSIATPATPGSAQPSPGGTCGSSEETPPAPPAP